MFINEVNITVFEELLEGEGMRAFETPAEGYECLVGGGEMGRLMRSCDWSTTPFGPVKHWPQSLRSTLSICLNSRFPIAIYWGPECLLLYNDAWRPIVGDKHPESLGRPARDVWPEIWSDIGPEFATVLATGEGIFHNDDLLAMHRFGYTEECFFDYTFNPIQGEGGAIDGILNIVSETTYRVLNDRRAQLLRELASKTGTAKTVEEAGALMAKALRSDPADIPFSLLYLIDADGKQARLSGSGDQLFFNRSIAPAVVDLDAEDAQEGWPIARVARSKSITAPERSIYAQEGWPIARVARTAQPEVIKDLAKRFGEVPGSPWPESPQEAMVLPIGTRLNPEGTATTGQGHLFGILVAVASPRRRLDDNYRDFFTQIAGQIATAVVNARSYEEERQRAEQLAELDRVKTEFFSNVSHEFRTPLTLMLGPVEDALQETQDAEQRHRLEMIHRNALRLQRLVNTLLDFSRIEAGRIEAVYEPTDLAMLTIDLAGVFRSAIEQAGLHLRVDCPPLPEPAYVDREMWEKIVLNLLSNAFKFTFEGEIAVVLRSCDDQIELTVRDTGTGISAAELPSIFERFHRVKGARGRSYEGSGIGLSLVQELVKLQGGTIKVSSIVNQETCFTVSIPSGCAHLPSERIEASRTLASTATGVAPYVEEVLRWLPIESAKGEEGNQNEEEEGNQNERDQKLTSRNQAASEPQYSALSTRNISSARILLADDNADMRDYLKRLLSQQYEVEVVKDGIAALTRIRQQLPDLLLTDVMMPGMSGFELLRSLRSDATTQDIPVILLSARAGEEARIEGLEAGADDYLTKPFSARELLARVEGTLKLAQLRREATQQEQLLRREAESARQQVETVLSSIRDGFYVLDHDWRFTYANDRHCEIIAMSRAEILGRSVWEVFPATVDTDVYEHFHRAMRDQTPMQFENLYAPWDRWYEHRIYPSPNGLTVFLAEITDRKQAELERERLLEAEQQARSAAEAAREEAQAANRIKDEFLAVLSHELRSPLNPILGWSMLLQTSKLDAAQTARAIATIQRNAKLQSELIEDLLDVSRILQGKLSLNVAPVPLASIIRAAMETVRLAADAKSINIEASLAPDVGLVSGDATRLQQVIWNLLSNAVKFTPEGGQVSIQLECLDSQAHITVSDTGQGIAPDFLPYVFDYFRQADAASTRKFGGLGLGLAIVRHLVELHGGTVRVESLGAGMGATFTVTLPLMPRQVTLSQNDQSLEPSSNLNGIQVLVVDDEADSRDFVAFVLEQAGATVFTTTTADEALALLIRLASPNFEGSKPDVLLSDIGMPETDGYMLIQQVRTLSPEQGGQIPAVALTAYAGDFNQQRALQAGFQQHVPKPVEPEKLVRAIAALVQENKGLFAR